MLAFTNEHNPPFQDVPAALQQKYLNQLFANLATNGIRVIGESNDGAMVLDLRELAVRNGSIEAGQRALIAALNNLHIAAVTVTAADIQYILGNNIITHGLARAVQSGLLGSRELLSLISIDELFANLTTLEARMVNDRVADPAVQAKLNTAAVADLVRAGHLTREDADEHNRLNAAPTNDPWASMRSLPPSPNEFNDHKPFKSPFDVEGY